MKKYIVLNLKIQNGEYEYSSKTIHEIPEEVNIDEFTEEYASEFYSKFSHEDSGTYYFNGGEVAVRVRGYSVITKQEYKILLKYI